MKYILLAIICCSCSFGSSDKHKGTKPDKPKTTQSADNTMPAQAK